MLDFVPFGSIHSHHMYTIHSISTIPCIQDAFIYLFSINSTMILCKLYCCKRLCYLGNMEYLMVAQPELESGCLAARDFKQKLLFLDYLITFNITCSGSGRSCLLLRRLTSQVVSTLFLDLSKTQLALHVPQHFSRIQPLIRYTFLYKGDSSY